MSFIGKNPNVNWLNLVPQSSDPSSPNEGDLFYSNGTSRAEGLWIYSNSNWIQTGEGTGSKNILATENSKFESGVGSWITYDDGAVSVPVDGTGGSASVISISGTTTGAEVLEGLQSLKISKSAADGQGEGTSVLTKTLDRADMGKPLFVYFSYDASHANYIYGDIQVYAYDITNAQLLTVYNDSNNGKLLQQKGLFSGVIYPQDTCAQVRLILHATSTNALAYNIFIDEVVITPQASIVSPVITEWTSYTPSGTWITNTTYTGKYRRVGDSMEIDVFVETSGAPTATTLSINLPSGYTIDTNKLSDLSPGVSLYAFDSSGSTIDSGNRSTACSALYSSTTSFQVLAENASGGSVVSNTAPFVWGAGDYLNIIVKVPIFGWSAGASLTANDIGLETIVATAGSSGVAQSIPTGSATTFINWTEELDNYNAFNPSTGKFTAPKSGNYRVAAQVEFDGSATGQRQINLFKNTSTVIAGATMQPSAGVVANVSTEWSGFLNINDTIEMKVTQNSGGNLNAGTIAGRTTIAINSIPNFNVFSVQGPIVISSQSDWTSYTPTSLNLGTLSAVNCWYKRIGDGIMIRGEFTVGTTVAASPPAFSLPNGYNLDTSKLAGDQLDYLGTVILANPTLLNLPDNTKGPFPLTYDATSGTNYLCIADDVDSDLGVFAFNNASGLLSSGNKISFFTSILPIAGLSSETRLYPTQRVIGTTYLKDSKTSGTNGGTFTSGAYQTRTLNTQEGDTGFCSLSSNQFILQPGTYEIYASAVAYSVDKHKIKIRNITDSTDVIIGSPRNSNTTGGVLDPSDLFGRITITASKTFELQHRCQTTKATDGLGFPATFGDSEIYATVRIDKIY